MFIILFFHFFPFSLIVLEVFLSLLLREKSLYVCVCFGVSIEWGWEKASSTYLCSRKK